MNLMPQRRQQGLVFQNAQLIENLF